MTARRRVLEICVDSPAGVAAAIAGGADRIELCAALELGGLTPSAGLVAEALRQARTAGVAIHAMVRPRAGGFAYDAHELALAVDEARALVAQGVEGLVFGACRDGRVDEAAVGRWVAAVRATADRPLALTFHRAIDLCVDPSNAVDAIAALGFDRILTSGGQATADTGSAMLRSMVARAADRCTIIAASGIRPDTVVALVADTGVTEVHASASVAIAEPDDVRAFGFAVAPRRTTDAKTVRALRTQLDAAGEIPA